MATKNAGPLSGPLIAVDGPAASGKGTIARALARHFGVPHLDTGALYRVVALSALRDGAALDDSAALARLAAAIDLSLLEDQALRTTATSDAASRISTVPEVRQALFDFQRNFSLRPGGAVLDGRDIGTVIAPHAPAKLFVVATPAVRARRRFLELARQSPDICEDAILADILARDARDTGRAVAPLRQAADAILLDTSNSDIDTSVREAINLVSQQLEQTA